MFRNKNSRINRYLLTITIWTKKPQYSKMGADFIGASCTNKFLATLSVKMPRKKFSTTCVNTICSNFWLLKCLQIDNLIKAVSDMSPNVISRYIKSISEGHYVNRTRPINIKTTDQRKLLDCSMKVCLDMIICYIRIVLWRLFMLK